MVRTTDLRVDVTRAAGLGEPAHIALTVTAMAACTSVAPEPNVEMRMICAGPAHTKSVLASAQPRLKWVLCASAPMPR